MDDLVPNRTCFTRTEKDGRLACSFFFSCRFHPGLKSAGSVHETSAYGVAHGTGRLMDPLMGPVHRTRETDMGTLMVPEHAGCPRPLVSQQ